MNADWSDVELMLDRALLLFRLGAVTCFKSFHQSAINLETSLGQVPHLLLPLATSLQLLCCATVLLRVLGKPFDGQSRLYPFENSSPTTPHHRRRAMSHSVMKLGCSIQPGLQLDLWASRALCDKAPVPCDAQLADIRKQQAAAAEHPGGFPPDRTPDFVHHLQEAQKVFVGDAITAKRSCAWLQVLSSCLHPFLMFAAGWLQAV